MRGSGGTEGGLGMFAVGFGLSALAMYLFFDSVRVSTAGAGLVSGWLGHGRGGAWETTSMGLLFVPFLLGVIALFYDARLKWAWGLMSFGIAVVTIEILSRLRFFFDMKVLHLLLMIALFGAGMGLMIRSFKEDPPKQPPSSPA